MKIYLYGINGVYNYGCEAMVRGISARFKEMYPTSQVIYKTISYENDSMILEDCKTVTVEKTEPKVFVGIQKNIVYRGMRYILKRLGIAKKEAYLHIRSEWLQECDILVIIGGDVFDLTPKTKNKRYVNERIIVSEIVKNNGGKVVLWGISIGDFDNNKQAKGKLFNYLKNTVDFSVIRDEKSYNYLTNNGVSNIKLFADPAYMLRTKQSKKIVGKRILGVNLSPLSNRHLNIRKTEDEWVEQWADVIAAAFEKLAFDEIMLIPHVVLKSLPGDDDLMYLEKVEAVLKNRGVNVNLVRDNKGYIGVKEYIIKCELILAARMHCAVNAISCGVPTIFLSYSPKSVGMCRLVYENEKMLFDMNNIVLNREDFLEKLEEISKYTVCIREYLAEKNLALYNDAVAAAKSIKNFLEGNADETYNK